jgi:ribosomal protein S18 acetylase RimI-like enzyme
LQHLHFSDLSLEEQTQALNQVYRDYAMPFQVDSKWVAEHLSCHQICPHSSPLWLDSRGVVALGLLAVRGKRAWIGGFGVSPAYRGQRLSLPLLRACLEKLTSESVQLEVLTTNLKAQATYRRGGFEITRELAVLEGRGGPPWLPIQPGGPPCWQREPESLQRIPGLVRVGDALAYRGNLIHLVQTGARWADLAGATIWRVSNEPVGSPLYQQLMSLGWREVARQFEMIR